MPKNGGEKFKKLISYQLEASLALQSFGHFGRDEVTNLKKMMRTQNDFLSKRKTPGLVWEGLRSIMIPKYSPKSLSVPLEKSQKTRIFRHWCHY